MVAKGGRDIIIPIEAAGTFTIQTAADTAIAASSNTIIDNLWNELESNGYTTTWDEEDEIYTRRDAANFLQCIRWVLQTANEKPMLDFAKGLFDVDGDPVFSEDKEATFIYSFEFLRNQINALPGVNSASQIIVANLVLALNTTISTKPKRSEPSTITAVGHTWSGILSGVALTKIPPARNEAKILDSILEFDQGLVIASGQDDQGSALFVGGMTIDSDTGELGGSPFTQAVNRIANKTVIARSF